MTWTYIIASVLDQVGDTAQNVVLPAATGIGMFIAAIRVLQGVQKHAISGYEASRRVSQDDLEQARKEAQDARQETRAVRAEMADLREHVKILEDEAAGRKVDMARLEIENTTLKNRVLLLEQRLERHEGGCAS